MNYCLFVPFHSLYPLFSSTILLSECQCNPIGVLAGPLCVAEDTALYIAGQCLCKPNVTGVRCDECEDGFLQFNDNNGSDNPCQCKYSESVY